jgi:GNAT superfamily N-acetyltransferase
MKYTAPKPLQKSHDLSSFNCGKAILNNWLHEKAHDNEHRGASRTYVICYENKVVGYYCLASGSAMRSTVPSQIRRNMPEPIPVMVLGRLAVDINHQGKGIGMGLVKDAMMRTLQAAKIVGIRAILVHALDEDAKKFYQDQCGFQVSPVNSLTLMISLVDIQRKLNLL